MSYDPSQVAFIDTETLGLDPVLHHIWEYAVIVDGVEHCWQAIWPREQEPIWSAVDPWVLENTGIKDRFDPITALPQIDAAERFADLTKGRHLVGACPWFDSERIHRVLLGWSDWGGRHGRALPWRYHLIDVETLIVGHLAGYGQNMSSPADWVVTLPWDSRELSRRVGVNPDDFEPHHTALSDARWAKACYEAVMGGPS